MMSKAMCGKQIVAFSATHAIMITLNLRGGGGRGEKEGRLGKHDNTTNGGGEGG